MFAALRLCALSLLGLCGLLTLPTPLGDLVAEPQQLLFWWESNGSLRASATVLQLAAVVGCAYLFAISAVVLLAGWCRAVNVQRAALRCAVPWLRRSIAAGATVGLLTVSSAYATDPNPATVRDLGPLPTLQVELPTPPVVTDLGPAPTQAAVEVHPVAVDPASAAPTVYEVQAGDNLWTIAARLRAAASDTRPRTRDVARYWSELVDLNRDQLTDPDLIVPGQLLLLPPLVRDPQVPPTALPGPTGGADAPD